MGAQRIASRIGDGTATIFEDKLSDTHDLKARQQSDLLGYASLTDVKQVTYKAIPDYSDTKGDELEVAIYYYHPDHLGSNTFISDMAGLPYQMFVNLPFGETMAQQTSAGTFQNVYKFNGKELDAESGLYYYGARYYDPRSSVWLSVDPLAEKYSNWCPYTYCLNNSIKLIDPDGRAVIAADANAMRNITNTLSKEESQYIRFDNKGMLDVSLLNQYKGSSENFTALQVLANSETNYVFAVSNDDINGNRFFEKGSDPSNPNNYSYGVTNMPGAEYDPSPDNNVYVFTASFLDEKTQARNTAHEAYAHAYFFELSKSDPSINPNHTKGVVGTGYEYDPYLKRNEAYLIFGNTNTKLEDQIKNVEQQAIKNYEDKNQ